MLKNSTTLPHDDGKIPQLEAMPICIFHNIVSILAHILLNLEENTITLSSFGD